MTINYFFRGILIEGDYYRDPDSDIKCSFLIGKNDLLLTLNDLINKKEIVLKIIIKDESFLFKGKSNIDLGFSFGSFPREPDFFYINNNNVLKVLSKYVNSYVEIEIIILEES